MEWIPSEEEYNPRITKEQWIISSNPEIFDAVSAFNELDIVDWKQSQKANFSVGDIVYIYISHKEQQIKLKTEVLKINIPTNEIIDDSKFYLNKDKLEPASNFMKLKLIKNIKGSAFTKEALELFDFKSPQGPIKIKGNLKEYLSFIEYLQNKTELIPNTYDASYELVTEVVKSYAKMQDLSECDYNDLDLIYLSTVGTWKHSVEKKIDSVNKSNLPQIEKERLIAYITNLWERVQSREFSHCEVESKITFGMFGTGFYTTKTKTDSFNAQKLIQMCIDLLAIDNDEKAFEIVEKNIVSGFKGLAAGGISVILHCLKPFIFPILNSNQGKNNIFENLGIELQKISDEKTYINNARKIKEYRDSNFTWKNYRIFDKENFESLQGDSEMEEPENIMNSNKRVWKVSHGTADFTEENITECLNGSYVCVHEYTKAKGISSTPQGRAFVEEVTPGDLFYLCRGNQRFLLIGEFTSEPVEIDEDGWAWRKYKKLYSSIKDGNYDGPSKWWTPNNNSTFIEIKKNDYSDFESLILKPFFGIDLKTLNITNGENNMEENQLNKYKTLLENNKNLILHGAPGTGKTHLAKEIAKAMGCEDDNIGFVQFHPSYDYTDFVEGLRPVEGDNGQVGFERKDGVFKEFCERALKKSSNAGESNFDDCWDSLIDYVRENLASDKLTKIGSWDYGLSSKESLKYSSVNSPSQYNFTITKQNVYDTYQGKKARPKGGFQKEMNQIVDFMKENFKLIPFDENEKNEIDNKPYIFIIDEINRGELSKIFGELFFSIEPSYRGTKGRVRTQYANMMKESNSFDDELNSSTFGNFFIPENVYIIGTMNDIDRSVESMDFAMRRRFVFKEVTAEESAVNMNLSQDAVDIMTRINNEIHKIEGLGDAYKIGGSYFLDVSDFEQLWELKLSSLIKEYLRGIDDENETNFKRIENAYFNKKSSSANDDENYPSVEN